MKLMKRAEDFAFVISFRVKKIMPRRKKDPVYTFERHRVKVIATKGRFLLCECQNCGDRELAADKIEAMGIYSRKPCEADFFVEGR